MPTRRVPLVTGQTYHVFNRGIDNRITFSDKREYSRALATLNFYHFCSPPLRFSYFLRKPDEERKKITNGLRKRKKSLVKFFAFCLMPNHFHFLFTQCLDGGIARFMSLFQNSFTRYFNTRHQRVGSLFLDQFKAVRIETDEQLLHVSRYIHLNPYSSFVVKNLERLKNYSWSSLTEYLDESDRLEKLCEVKEILSFFRSKSKHLKFIFDQADYQRELEKIKRLTLEDFP